MFRLLAVFTVAVGVLFIQTDTAEAGGGGKSARRGTLEATNGSAFTSIKVFYRPAESGSPGTAGEIRAYPSVTVSPRDTERVRLQPGTYELVAVDAELAEDPDVDDDETVPNKNSGDPGYTVVTITGGATTRVFVGDSSESFGFAAFY